MINFKTLLVICSMFILAGCFHKDELEVGLDELRRAEIAKPIRIVPIPEVYLTNCIKPNPPNESNMLAYELALRDAVISYRECDDMHKALIHQVRERGYNE